MNVKGRNPLLDAGDADLARRLQRMWPHREHESGVLRSLLCALGLHLWLQPEAYASAPRRAIHFCPWCAAVRIDGILYH